MRIYSLKEVAERDGVSVRTIQRVIDAKAGPVITQLSKRRIGVAEDDYVGWRHESAQIVRLA